MPGFPPQSTAPCTRANARTGKVPKPSILGDTAVKVAGCRHLPQVGEVLDDVDARSKQGAMGRPFPASLGVVDSERVDPDQGDSRRDEVPHAIFAEERSTRAVGRTAEVTVPAGVNEYGRIDEG